MPTFTNIFREYHKGKLKVKGESVKVPFWSINKLSVEKFCEENNIPRAEVLRTWGKPEKIDLEGLPDGFVIKPANLNSSRGALVLERQGEGVFYDHYNDEQLDLEGVRRVQQREYDKVKAKECHRLERFKIITQERVIDRDRGSNVVTDFKFWVIGNKVKYIRLNDCGDYDKITICFYDENFSMLPEKNEKVVLNYSDAIHIEHKVLDIETRKEMLEFSENVSRIMGASFARIDLFLTDSGIKLGEITPVPGSPYNGKYFAFTEEFDQELGNAWAEALGMESV